MAMTYGPVDFLALEFDNLKLKGEIMPALMELVEKKVVRVIDLVVVQKDADGKYEALEVQQLAPEVIAIFDPLMAEISGIIQVEDVEAIAEQMENGTTAALLLFENLWAVKFKEALLRANGRLLMQERIPHEVVEEAMEIFAKTGV
jgi:uncharacterized membrane protein